MNSDKVKWDITERTEAEMKFGLASREIGENLSKFIFVLGDRILIKLLTT